MDPTQKIEVTLTAAQWNAVLVQLMQGPWAQVNEVIGLIRDQCARATQDSTAPPGDIAQFRR